MSNPGVDDLNRITSGAKKGTQKSSSTSEDIFLASLMKSALANLGLGFISLAIFFGLLEFFVFRVIVAPSDLPYLSSKPSNVLKYEAGQTGVYRIKNEIAAPFSINEDGWNSTETQYREDLHENEKRICVVGDSYVESLQVAPDKNFAEIAAYKLREEYGSVYRFGISGAPLSHYLYMIETEILRFKPAVLVVNLVHNDFRESWVAGGGTYDASLARFKFNEDGRVVLSVPEPYQRNWTWWLKTSATFRYLWVRWKIRPQKLKSIFVKRDKSSNLEEEYVANIQVKDALDRRIAVGVDHAFRRLKDIEETEGLKGIVILDSASRGARGRQPHSQSKELMGPVAKLERMVLSMAEKYDLTIIDLAEVFFRNFQRDEIPFSFRHDGHWNAYAHRIVGGELTRAINSL